MGRSACVLLALACAACACTGAAKRESAVLLDAVERYRAARDAAKAERAEELAAVSCSDARICEAKRACLDAVVPTTRALLLRDEAAARLADVEQKRLAPDAPEAAALPAKLDEAEKLLETGRAKMSDCERRLADLRVAFGP